MVFADGVAGFDDIHDHVREAQDRGQLDAPVQLDDIDLPAQAGVMLLGDVRKFRGHAHRALAVLHIILSGRHAHPAAPQAQIQKLVHVGTALHQNVLPHDAHVGGMMFHVDRHVARLDEQIAHAVLPVLKHQLAVFLVNTLAVIADRGQKLVHLIAQPSLGKRDIQHPISSSLRPPAKPPAVSFPRSSSRDRRPSKRYR